MVIGNASGKSLRTCKRRSETNSLQDSLRISSFFLVPLGGIKFRMVWRMDDLQLIRRKSDKILIRRREPASY